MQIPLSWLNSFFSHPLNSKILDQALTKAGIEVDLIQPFIPPFTQVVCARVESVQPHPDASKLQVASVFDGRVHYTVVCGASNCRAGLRVAFAKIGSILGTTNPLEIKKRAVRGVESEGMLCSADELGLSQEQEPGIIELDDWFPLGSDLQQLLSDEIISISITPNLGHVLSLLGVARELSAFLKLPLKLDAPIHHNTSLPHLPIEILSPACQSYYAFKLEVPHQAPTPFIMQHRLRLAGFKPKNIVVDILNYVMFEQGQPMHSFDADKLQTDHLRIQLLEKQAPFEALNGKNYTLEPGTLVIQTQHQIAAVAGVIGSLNSSCSQNTKTVIIESALFNSQAVRSDIKSLDLRTEAATRFEKGIDPQGCLKALCRAVDLLSSLTGAKAVASYNYHTPFVKTGIGLRTLRVNKLLGSCLAQTEIVEMLKRLDMHCEVQTDELIQVTPPSYRHDVVIEEDLIEEVGRLYGLEHLKGHLIYQAPTILDNPLFTYQKHLKKALFSQGLQEILTCDLLSKSLALDFKLDHDNTTQPIEVLHPRSQDQSTLRLSLLSSFIPVVIKNISNKQTDLALFEVGKIHAKRSDHMIESLQAGLLLTGLSAPYYFDPNPKECDFFDLKGMVETILDDLGINDYTFKISHDKTFHPYQQLRLYHDRDFIGALGQIHPELLKQYGIDQKVFFAQLCVAELMNHKKTIYPAELPPTQPYIERDWTVSVSKDTSYQQIITVMNKLKPELVVAISLLDIYHGNNNKNITVRIRYRHKEKSLESSFIDQIQQNFMTDVAKNLDLSL
jgi:phenylalanyl-tRNA synthetase beta chain